jgi:KUP system potassium uptake protein
MKDETIPNYSTNLVYLASSPNAKEIEHKIMYSIFNMKPKRANVYWFVHVEILDDPYSCEYYVDHIVPNEVIRVEFRLGFRVEQRITLMLKQVVQDMIAKDEVNEVSRHPSLAKYGILGDFKVIVMEKFLSRDNELPVFERIVMRFYFWLKEISLSEERGFGLDTSTVTVEKFPLIISPVTKLKLKRVSNITHHHAQHE